MRKHFSSAIALTLLLFVGSSAQRSPTADAVLQRTAAKLAAVKALGYTYTRELNYPSEDYLNKSTAVGYLEMRPVGIPAGFRFHFEDDEYIAVYNGTERFVAVKTRKIMQVDSNPKPNMLEGSASLYNSPLTLKHVLPKIIADKKIVKTLTSDHAGEIRRYLIEFALPKATISGLGDIREIRSERTTIYRIAIDAKTYLPLEVLQTNDKNKDFTRTTFANLTEKAKAPPDLLWYYSTYAKDYKIQRPDDKKLIEAGKTPPDFALRQFESDANVSLESHKGKVVLLEFWIAHCGFCIAAVPKLNEIAKTFSGPDFELISVNIHDQANTIASFKKRHSPGYTILWEGEKTSDEYGVGAYPAIVLIGKDGKIAYSSLGLFEKELEAAIRTSLGR